MRLGDVFHFTSLYPEPKQAHDFDLITRKTWGFVGENCINVGDESSLMSECVSAESWVSKGMHLDVHLS